MTNIRLEIDDSRRLTGKNFFSDQPGAVLDAFVSGIDKHQVVNFWLEHLAKLLGQVGWADAPRFFRVFEDGVSVGFDAPIDALYTATEINEAAWNTMAEQLLQITSPSRNADASEHLSELVREERNPKLSSLIAAAETHNVAYLVDDESFSLGHGVHAEVWSMAALPTESSLQWGKYKTVPIAMVTGTNGKSTTVRLTSQIIQQAGLRCGLTSTDFIRVGDTVLDKGDYSGPGGARLLLRHPETEAALLEVARGGLLRRGLPVPQVDAVLVTNVAEDHLGQYGINTVAALTAAKMMIAKAAYKAIVLNADDTNLVAYVSHSLSKKQSMPPLDQSTSTQSALVTEVAQEPVADNLNNNIIWFSLYEDNPVIMASRKSQRDVCFLRAEKIIYATHQDETTLIDVKDIPMALQGAAVHNVHNALGAVALSKALGIDDQAITTALRQFKSDATDNPGRGNLFEYSNAKVILDFAHNVHSMTAMANTIKKMPAGRKILLLCQAGDRSDSQTRALTLAAMAMQPDMVWVCELPDYLRGRELGSMSKVIASAVRETGLPESKIHFATSPLQGSKEIVQQLQTDDLAFIMALSQRDAIAALVAE